MISTNSRHSDRVVSRDCAAILLARHHLTRQAAPSDLQAWHFLWSFSSAQPRGCVFSGRRAVYLRGSRAHCKLMARWPQIGALCVPGAQWATEQLTSNKSRRIAVCGLVEIGYYDQSADGRSVVACSQFPTFVILLTTIFSCIYHIGSVINSNNRLSAHHCYFYVD